MPGNTFQTAGKREDAGTAVRKEPSAMTTDKPSATLGALLDELCEYHERIGRASEAWERKDARAHAREIRAQVEALTAAEKCPTGNGREIAHADELYLPSERRLTGITPERLRKIAHSMHDVGLSGEANALEDMADELEGPGMKLVEPDPAETQAARAVSAERVRPVPGCTYPDCTCSPEDRCVHVAEAQAVQRYVPSSVAPTFGDKMREKGFAELPSRVEREGYVAPAARFAFSAAAAAELDAIEGTTMADVIAWADGVAGALGTEYASRVTESEAKIAQAIRSVTAPSARSATRLGEWIPVGDRLPENDNLVLVAYRPGAHARPDGTLRKRPWSITVARHAGGAWRFVMPSQKSRLTERVKFWQPLPAEPKSASDSGAPAK